MYRYEIMTECWRDDPGARPSFSDICMSIEHIVDTAEHLPLPVQSSHTPVHTHTPGAACTALDQPSPSYSNCTFDSVDDDDDGVAPLYRNCVISRSPGTSAVMVD